jgi:hypothetical protein
MNTVTNSRYLLLAIACTANMALATDQTNQPKKSFSRSLLASVEQTVDAVKKNPECLDDIDTVVEQAKTEIKHISQEVKKTVSPEQLKALSKAVKQEADHLECVIKSTVNQSAKKIDSAIDATVAPQQKADLVKEVSTSVKSIDATCRKQETKAHFQKLGHDLKAAGQAAAESVTTVTEGIDDESEEAYS